MKSLKSGVGGCSLALPIAAIASETEGGYITLGLMFSIPSMIVFGICAFVLWRHAARAEQRISLVFMLPWVVLPAGVTFTRYGAPIPFWANAVWEIGLPYMLWPTLIAIGLLYGLYLARRIHAAHLKQKA
ncbi:MAG: hypothetical protein AABY95_08310 [Pseudomonadota bacterium]